ncbi:MAG: helix-turn-helix domain-containing protein [Polyangiaceae bacterium]
MKVHRWNDIKNKNMSRARQRRVAAQAKADLLAMDLAELRKEAGVTQVEMADELEMTQSEISKLEKRDERLVSTIRRYVEGLGGKLEVVAVIGNKRITLSV